jgi:hypothetical protein
MSEMDETGGGGGAAAVAGPAVAGPAVAGGADYLYGELVDTLLTNEIQEYLFTKIIPPKRLLSECFTCFLLSVPQRDLPDDSLPIQKVISCMSCGNHATIVCKCDDNVGSPEGRITAILKGEVLASGRGVTTRRYDQAVGVAQPLFNHSVDRLKELFVLGKGATEFNPAQLGEDVWEVNWPVLAGFIRDRLNEGIREGREAFKEKLKVLFEKIRALNDSDPKTRELRAKYCIMALDLLRDDIFQSFESTIQKGVLATINIHNSSDEYDRHHGKPVTDRMLAKAPYNLLILVNVVIGGFVYTIHMEIDREAVKELLFHASTHDRKMGDDIYQSASYWIGDVIKWIHENKNEFFSIVKDVLDKSVPNVTGGVAPQIGYQHKKYLLRKMEEMPGQRPEIPLYQAIYVSGCKCFTLYHPDISFRNVGDRPASNRCCIVTTPNSDMTVGYYKERKYFVSVKPITVTRPSGDEYTITDVNFTLDTAAAPAAPLFHVPTYDTTTLVNQVLKPDDGDVFDSNGLFNSPDTGSARIQDSVKSAAAAMEYEDAAAAAAKAEAEAAAAAVKKANFEMNQAKTNAVSKMSADQMGPSVKGVNKKQQQQRTSPSQTKNTDDPQKANEKKTLAYEKAGSAYKKADLAKKKVNAKAVAVASLIEEVKVGITNPETQPTELVKHIVSQEKTTPGILKQALNTICSTFHYLLSPFTSLQRLGVVIPHTVLDDGNNSDDGTKLLDPDTAMSISIVLMCAWNYFENDKTRYTIMNKLGNAELKESRETRHLQAVKDKIAALPKLSSTNLTISKNTSKQQQQQQQQQHVRLENEFSESKSRLIEASKLVTDFKMRRTETDQKSHEIIRIVDNMIPGPVDPMQQEEEYGPVYCREEGIFITGGMRRRTLRRGVKKNTRRERRDRSIRSRRCRRDCRDCWQYSRSSSKLNKNTQRCRSRNSKTRRRRRTANRQ